MRTEQGGLDEYPLVSVIIPTHNRANMVSRAIESVLNQTYKNLELIIVDDCSEDNTGEVVRKYKDLDNRVSYWRNEPNIGPGASRNLGVSKAKGQLVAFLDDDDEWLPFKLELQAPVAQNYSVVGSLLTYDYRPKNHHKTMDNKPGIKQVTLAEYAFERKGLAPSAMVIKTEYFRSVGGFDPSKGCDGIDLGIRLISNFGPGAYIVDYLYIMYTDSSGQRPRISTRKNAVQGAIREFEKNRHLMPPDALNYRLYLINLQRSQACQGLWSQFRWLLKAIRLFDISRPTPYAKGLVSYVLSGRWPFRNLIKVYHRIKYS